MSRDKVGLHLPTSTLTRSLLLDALAYEAQLLAERNPK